ncbi:MAG: hypothetical protein EBU33_00860 [Sphingobacteriia bacterium]|nr:hypothetical protein [Sphingobacteriia bacterium]
MRISTILFTVLIILFASQLSQAKPLNKASQCVAPWVNRTQSTHLAQLTQLAKTTQLAEPTKSCTCNKPQVNTERPEPFTKAYMKKTLYAYIDLSFTYFILVSVLHLDTSAYMTIQLAMIWMEFNDIRAFLAMAINK